MILRLAYLALVMAPFTLVSLTLQLILLAITRRAWRVLPRLFFILLAFGFGLRVTVHGKPAADAPVLLVSNHISWLDIPAIASVAQVRFVAKSDVAHYPLVGVLSRLAKTIFVDRTRRSDAGRTAGEMSAALGVGDMVLLFAEGTSDIGTHVLPFKSALIGAAETAMRDAGAKTVFVQPVAIAYTAISGLPLSRHERGQIAWVGDMGVGDNFRQILASGVKSVAIAFGTPIPVDVDRKALTREAEAQVRAMLVTLNRNLPVPANGVFVETGGPSV